MKLSKEIREEYIYKIDKAISELVYDKTLIQKAYNYYHGVRDPEQFRHLEENFGIGTATSVEFVPLVRKHIDVLVGEYLSIPQLPRISCKDPDTISRADKAKMEYINDEISKVLLKHVDSIIKEEAPEIPHNKISDYLDDMQENLDKNFISDFEIAAQNIIDWTRQSKDIDYLNKLRMLLTDLLVTGSLYYRIIPSTSETSIDFKVLNPKHTFLDRNFDSIYHKHSQRAVIREYLTKSEIYKKYGKYLTKEDFDILENGSERFGLENSLSVSLVREEPGDGILGGLEARPYKDYNSMSSVSRWPVYDVEWLDIDKDDPNFKMHRYNGIRIGASIYILLNKDNNVVRSKTDPNNCTLSVNGMFYSDRNGDPFSLILATANLQD